MSLLLGIALSAGMTALSFYASFFWWVRSAIGVHGEARNTPLWAEAFLASRWKILLWVFVGLAELYVLLAVITVQMSDSDRLVMVLLGFLIQQTLLATANPFRGSGSDT